MVPSSRNETNPYGARSRRSDATACGTSPSSSSAGFSTEVFLHRANRFLGMAHVRTVARGFHHPQGTEREMAVHVLAHFGGCDDIRGALENERRHADIGEIVPVVGEERHLREPSCDDGIGGA